MPSRSAYAHYTASNKSVIYVSDILVLVKTQSCSQTLLIIVIYLALLFSD